MTHSDPAVGDEVPRPAPRKRAPTTTSAFGVSRRESHDSSGFYARFTPPAVTDDARVDPHKAIDEIVLGDARAMDRVPDRSVALVVTSPPYFAGKEYEEALGQGHVPGTYLDYLRMLTEVFAECVRTLEPGGRIAVNVANLGRRPFRNLAADVTSIVQDELRLLLRGEIVWWKQRGAAGSCAWGSFQRPANPVLRDLTERVVVASKGRFDRAVPASVRARRGLPSVGSMSRDEFMEATTDVWEIAPESATRVGHPAPFPVELPARLIHLHTYYGDLVLDPFMGAGTTAVAAVRTGRHFVGYDTDPEYVALARRRVAAEQESRGREVAERVEVRTSGPPRAPDAALASGAPTAAGADAVARAIAGGASTKDLAAEVLRACGFDALEPDARVADGVEVTWRARDAGGRVWLFEVAGARTSVRPGLARADVLWRAVGKAAVVHEVDPEVPFVVLTTGRPSRNSAADRALRVVVGPDRAIRDVVVVTEPADRARLAALGSSAGAAPGPAGT